MSDYLRSLCRRSVDFTAGAVRPRAPVESQGPAVLGLTRATPLDVPPRPDGTLIRVWAPVDRSRLEGAGLQRNAAVSGHAIDPGGPPEVSPPVLPRASMGREDEGPRRRGETAPDGGPIIRVTIGRVEVRADATDAESGRSRSRRRREPPLSLEDYLKRRGEEGA